MNEKKLAEIRETFEKAEKLLEGTPNLSSDDVEYLCDIKNILGWVLGEYTQNPLEDY